MPVVIREFMRETVEHNRAVYKFGYMLETPSIRQYSCVSLPLNTVEACAVTICPVRSISRKGWMPT